MEPTNVDVGSLDDDGKQWFIMQQASNTVVVVVRVVFAGVAGDASSDKQASWLTKSGDAGFCMLRIMSLWATTWRSERCSAMQDDSSTGQTVAILVPSEKLQ